VTSQATEKPFLQGKKGFVCHIRNGFGAACLASLIDRLRFVGFAF